MTVYEQNVERATKSELWAAATRSVLAWSPGPQLRRRRTGDDARRRPGVDVDSRQPARVTPEGGPRWPTSRASTDRHPTPRPRGRRLAGFAAFLAACGTKPATPSRAPSRRGAVDAAVGRAVADGRVAPRRRRPPTPRRRQPSSTGRTGRYYIDVDPNDADQAPTTSTASRRSTARPSTTRRSSRATRTSSPRSSRPPERQGHRLGRHHADRLDGRQAHPPRLDRGVRAGQRAERDRQHQGRLQGRHVGPERRPPRAVAVRDDRHRLRHGQGRRRHQPRPAVHGRPALEGQGRVPDRDARRHRPLDAPPRARSGAPRRGTAATRPSR